MPKKSKAPKAEYVVAIDPGTVNLGIVKMRVATGEVVDHVRLNTNDLEKDPAKAPKHESLLRKICKAVKDRQSRLRQRFFSKKESIQFLIESQKYPTNHDVELALYGCLFPRAKKMDPRVIKRHFHFDKKRIMAFYNKDDNNLKTRWDLSHNPAPKIKRIQKKSAVFASVKVFRQRWVLEYSPKMDDVADAYLMCRHYADSAK